MKGIKTHNEISDYLNGQLFGEQLAQFENRIETDTELKDEVEMQRFANEAIISSEKLNIKKQLQAIHAQHQKALKQKRIKIIIAAIISIIIVVWLLLTYLPDNNINNSIIDQRDVSDKTIIDNSNDAYREETSLAANNSIENPNDKTAYYANLIAENLKENNISNSDSIVEIYGPIELILKDPEKYYDQIILANNEDSLDTTIDEKQDSVSNQMPLIEDPCLITNEITPKYELTQPTFGGEDGILKFDNQPDEQVLLTDFSIDNGITFFPVYEDQIVARGTYQIISKDRNGCASQSLSLNVTYKDANYVMQASQNKFWEIEIPAINELPLDLEIRNARTGTLVFRQHFEYSERFIWTGINQNDEALPLGNYVFMFMSIKHGLIAKGQITLL
ncbi:MAG: hypothetical protein ACI8ZM_004803 [Crocinitomix sp.]|jgi:hypothetical protein